MTRFSEQRRKALEEYYGVHIGNQPLGREWLERYYRTPKGRQRLAEIHAENKAFMGQFDTELDVTRQVLKELKLKKRGVKE